MTDPTTHIPGETLELETTWLTPDQEIRAHALHASTRLFTGRGPEDPRILPTTEWFAAYILTGERAKAEEAAFQRGIQAGREQAARDIQDRANAREAFLGTHATEDDRVWAGWLREAARIAVHGTRLTARTDWRPDTRTYQDGREDAARALLACTICGTVHPCRDIGDGERTYAALTDGHAYCPAAGEASGLEELAAIARGDQPAQSATEHLYGGSGPGGAAHCDRCAQVGHVAAHPDLGCGDVGCTAHHPEEDR